MGPLPLAVYRYTVTTVWWRSWRMLQSFIIIHRTLWYIVDGPIFFYFTGHSETICTIVFNFETDQPKVHSKHKWKIISQIDTHYNHSQNLWYNCCRGTTSPVTYSAFKFPFPSSRTIKPTSLPQFLFTFYSLSHVQLSSFNQLHYSTTMTYCMPSPPNPLCKPEHQSTSPTAPVH